MKKKNNEKGITLIALIITIIVMLLMVAVTIRISVNGGLFGYAQNASVGTKAAKEAEKNWTDIEEGMSTEYLIAKYTYGASSEDVARIGSTLYTSLQDAIDAVEDNNEEATEIILLQSVSECVTVPAGKNIVLNLDNNQVTNNEDEPTITVNGVVQVKNGKVTGTFGLDVPTVQVNQDAEIDFSNTNVSRNSEDEFFRETVELHGTLKIDSGKIENTNSCAIWSYTDSDVVIEISGTAELYSSAEGYVTLYNNTTGNCKITGGKITSLNTNAIRQEGILEIGGTAKISSEAAQAAPTIYIYAGSDTTITGGDITSINGQGVYNRGTLEIKGTPKISSVNGQAAVYTAAGSDTTITGGNITNTNLNTVVNKGTLVISGTANIHSDAPNNPVLYGYAGSNTTITGGTISSSGNNAIYNKGTMTIGGTANIRATPSGFPTIYNTSILTISGGTIYSLKSYGLGNTKDGNATITGGTIISEESYAINNNNGTCTVSGARIVGPTIGID